MGGYGGNKYGYKGDDASKEKLIIEYLPLIRKISGKLSIALPPTLDENDLIGSGIIGLLEAMERFDPARGVDFRSFASLRIKGAMIDELRKLSWAPRSFFTQYRHVQEAGERVAQEIKREPTSEEIARELGWTVNEVDQVWTHYNLLAIISMERVLFAGDDNEGLRLEELLAATDDGPDDHLEKKERVALLARSLKELTEREQILLSLYYHEDLTQKEIARLLNISAVRVSQIHAGALQRLRKLLGKMMK